MPRGDRSGPEGRGPMTGRSLGYCAGNDRPGFEMDAVVPGRGFGRGRGFRRSCGNGYGYGFGRRFGGLGQGLNFPVRMNTANSLVAEVASLKDQLQALEKRLAELKSSD